MAITNGTFDINLTGWTQSGNSTTYLDSGRAHIRSNSQYGASSEQFAYFYQTFLLDKPVLRFDIQPIIAGDGDYACGDCLSYPYYFPIAETCGWTIKDNAGNVIKHEYVYGTTLQTISIDLSDYVGQDIKISFQAGAARYTTYGHTPEYYDLLVDNVMTSPGILFNPICSDTAQHCTSILYFDGNYQGTTPYYIAPSIGSHTYTLYKSGYAKYDGTINVNSAMITDGATIEPILDPGGGIINGTFDTDLSGWIPNANASWDSSGRAKLTQGGQLYQVFAITDNLITFDWEVNGTNGGAGYQIFIDGVLKISDSTGTGSGWGNQSGTKTVYLGNYLGKTAKLLFNRSGWPYTTLYIDNIFFSHTTGIFNGGFESGLVGWDSSSTSIYTCSYWGISPPCSGSLAVLEEPATLSQTFIIDKCALKFDWWTWGNVNGYNISVDSSTVVSKTLPASSSGTEIVDLSAHIGSYATITFYSNQYELDIDNITTITNPYDISVVSYPSGAEIFVDNVDTGQVTGNTPVIVDGGSEGIHTVKLSLAGYPDYVETINITSCITTYVSATFGGCVTFITDPPGAKICIDNTDTDEVTPKTFCGYLESHTYSLFLKNYRVETDTITFPSDKGLFINKTLTYETGSVRFNIDPSGSKIIIDGTDTGKLTPDVVDNLLIGYHSYEIRKDDYYSLTGSFRIIVDTEKQITESLQQVTGIDNGRFDTNIDGWNLSSSNLAQGYAEWLNGQAHLITNGIPITFSKDFVVTEDSLVFYYYPPVSLNANCNIGWNVIANPDTPEQTTIASYCGYGRSSEHWGYFEVDLSQYIGSSIRLNLNLTGNKIFYIGGPAEAYLDNVGQVKPRRSITFDNYCIKKGCYVNPIVDRCSADIYLDNNFIGTNPIQANSLVLGNHSYVEKNKGYISLDTGTEDTTGKLSFSQGVPAHFYIDGLYSPSPLPPIPPGEGCLYIESNPPGAEIFLDGATTGKITPNTICNISLTSHNYELKLFSHTVYKGSFTLYPGFGEYLSVNITGSIYFTSTPSGAEIFLDGNDLGIKTPRLVNNILAGNHDYTLKLQYYLDYIGTIYVVGEP